MNSGNCKENINITTTTPPPTHTHTTPTTTNPLIQTHRNTGPLSPIFMLFKQGSGNLSVVTSRQTWQIAALLWALVTSPISHLRPECVCVEAPLGAEQHLLLVVKCSAVEWLGTGRGCGDAQPLVALLCGVGPVACSSDRLSKLWSRPPFVAADSGWVCFPCALPPPSLPLFQYWLRHRGSEVVRGWTTERGVYLGNGDLFVCTRAEYPSPFF